MNEAALISCRQLVPEFDDFVLEHTGLDLDIAPGEIVSIIGPDYSGKSEWLSSLAGINPLQQGSISFSGMASDTLDRDGWSQLRRRLAYVRSDTAVLSAATPRQNVILPAVYHRMPTESCSIEAAAELLDQLGVTDQFSLPAYLRPDQRFRIAIARALILQPDALILDTPFTRLDAFATEVFQQYLLRRVREDGLSIVTVTHDVNFAIQHSDRLLFITRDDVQLFEDCDDIKRCDISVVRNYLEKSRLS